MPLAISLRDRVDAEVRSQARGQADVVAATVSGNLDDPRDARRHRQDGRGEAVRGRVVVTDPEGALLADSAGTDRLGTDYGDRPEIAQALRTGSPVQDRRRSDTLDQEILATAVPVVERGHARGRRARDPERRGRLARDATARRSAWPRSACSCSASGSPRAS